MKPFSGNTSDGIRSAAAVCFAVFVSVYLQYQLPPLAASLMEEMGLSASAYSSVFSAPLIPSIALSVVFGLLADRFGLKPVLLGSAALACAGAVLRVFAQGFGGLFAAMLLIGILPTALNVNVSRLFGTCFSAEKLPRMMGLFYGASMLGMTAGNATTALFACRRDAFVFSAVLSALALAAMLFCLRNLPSPAAERQGTAETAGFLRTLKNPHVLLMGGILGLVMAGNVCLSGFLPGMLTDRGMDSVNAGLLSSVYLVGTIVSTLALPAIAAKLKSTRLVVLAAALISAAGTAAAGLLSGGALPPVLFLTGLCANGVMPLLMALPMILADIGRENASTACGVMNTMQMAGAVVLPTFVLVPLSGGGQPALFLCCGGMLLLAALLSLKIPESK